VGVKATLDEDVVHLDIGCHDGGGFAVFDWFGDNVVAVVIVEDEQVAVALAGREGQLAGEITVALAGRGSINDCSEQVVCALAILEGRGKRSGSGSRERVGVSGLVERWFFWVCLRWALAVATALGVCLQKDSRVRPGRTWSSLVATRAASKVEGTGDPMEAWEKATSSLIFVG